MIEPDHFTALPVLFSIPLTLTGWPTAALALVTAAYGWLFVIARFERGERDVDC